MDDIDFGESVLIFLIGGLVLLVGFLIGVGCAKDNIFKECATKQVTNIEKHNIACSVISEKAP